MVIISTFNSAMYKATGRFMLQSAKQHCPKAKRVIYHELPQEELKQPDCKGVEKIAVCELDNFKTVFEENKDVITKQFGGNATEVHGDKSWNIRWFGWFRKIVMGHHAVCVAGHEDYMLFTDSDMRYIKPFPKDHDWIGDILDGHAVGYFRGNRDIIESGFVVVNGKHEGAKIFYQRLMDMYLSKEFRKYPIWADHYMLTKCVERSDTSGRKKWSKDFAAGKSKRLHRNSTGYITGGQVIPHTEWGKYVEHDKGWHWKNDIVPHYGMSDPGNTKNKPHRRTDASDKKRKG